MKLNVTFDNYYGGSVDEDLLLPLDINGVLFERIEEGVDRDAVYLGEIAGKHSECYGDLEVEIIDLNKLTLKEVTNLINRSDLGEFETFLEELENSIREKDKYDEDEVKSIFKSYGVEYRLYMQTFAIYDKFIDSLKDEWVQNFRNITILEKEYDKVIELLKDNGVEYFQ